MCVPSTIAAYGEAAVGEHEHELVADLFDDLSGALRGRLADQLREAVDDPCCGGVAHGFGQGREARQVDEQDGAAELSGLRGRIGGLLGEVEHHVLPERLLPRFAVEEEHGRLDQLEERNARGVGRFEQRAAADPGGA